MTDQELLQAMKAMLAETKQDIRQEIQESEKRIMQNVAVLMDADFGPRFSALSEQIDLFCQKLTDPEVIEALDCRVSALELSVKKLNRDVKQLKATNG